MYIQGVSTRKVTNIVQELCGVEISKSQVSALASDLDKGLNQWRHRRIDKIYPYLVVDARHEKVQMGIGIVSWAVMIVIGISEEEYREILSIQIGKSENNVDWGNISGSQRKRLGRCLFCRFR